MNIYRIIYALQLNGWTVSFPAFGGTAAMLVVATKGDQRWQRGWTAENYHTLDDAIQGLSGDTGVGVELLQDNQH